MAVEGSQGVSGRGCLISEAVIDKVEQGCLSLSGSAMQYVLEELLGKMGEGKGTQREVYDARAWVRLRQVGLVGQADQESINRVIQAGLSKQNGTIQWTRPAEILLSS